MASWVPAPAGGCTVRQHDTTTVSCVCACIHAHVPQRVPVTDLRGGPGRFTYHCFVCGHVPFNSVHVALRCAHLLSAHVRPSAPQQASGVREAAALSMMGSSNSGTSNLHRVLLAVLAPLGVCVLCHRRRQRMLGSTGGSKGPCDDAAHPPAPLDSSSVPCASSAHRTVTPAPSPAVH